MISGSIGVVLLVTLRLPRPLMYYLARSTIAREDLGSALEFETRWREYPELGLSIRRMTIVWGIGLMLENLVRCAIVWRWANQAQTAQASAAVSYAAYGALTLWTFWYRRGIRRRVPVRVDRIESAEQSPK
jgi:hypothetical protein